MEDLVKEAEQVILSLKKGKDGPLLKTSQIRKILSAVTIISSKLDMEQARMIASKKTKTEMNTISKDLAMEIRYLKVKIAYQAGRESFVEDFVVKANLNEYIDAIGNSVRKYREFAKYVEALVAYHRFRGGRD